MIPISVLLVCGVLMCSCGHMSILIKNLENNFIILDAFASLLFPKLCQRDRYKPIRAGPMPCCVGLA